MGICGFVGDLGGLECGSGGPEGLQLSRYTDIGVTCPRTKKMQPVSIVAPYTKG